MLNFTGITTSRDLGHAPFRNIIYPGFVEKWKSKLCTKFEVSNFTDYVDIVEGMSKNYRGHVT